MTGGPREAVAGFVLAGGRSVRMGRDKALVELHGRSLLALAVEKLEAAGLSVAIAGARSDPGEIAPVIADEAPDEGPLRGVCTALASSTSELAVFLPVDLPLVPVSLLQYMIGDALVTNAAVTLASVNGFSQTFPAVLRTELLPFLREELGAGRGGCFAAFCVAARRAGAALRVVSVEMLAQAGRVGDQQGLATYQWFLNVNTPEDLGRAAGLRVS